MDPVAEARQLYRQGRFSEAEEIAREALMGDEKNAHLLLLLGDVRSRAGDLREAIDFFERCLPLHKDPARVLRRLLAALLKAERWRDAREMWAAAEGAERKVLRGAIAKWHKEQTNDAAVPEDPTQPRWVAWWLIFLLGASVREQEAAVLRVVHWAKERQSLLEFVSAIVQSERLPRDFTSHLAAGLNLVVFESLGGDANVNRAVEWIMGEGPTTESSVVLTTLRRILILRVLPALRKKLAATGELAGVVRALSRMREVLPGNAQLDLLLGDGLMRLQRIPEATSVYEEVLRFSKYPERVRLRLLAAYAQSGEWANVIKSRDAMETEWGAFRAALACFDFTEALRLGRGLVRVGEPFSDDWLPAYLGLLFELNLMGDALSVLHKIDTSDPVVERYRFWLAWEGVEPKVGDVLTRVGRFRGSTDADITWCLRALTALTSNEADVESLGEVLAARPEELVSPLSAIGVQLSARLEAAWWQRRKTAKGTPLARRQWELMPYFIRSRRKGKSFNVHVAR